MPRCFRVNVFTVVNGEKSYYYNKHFETAQEARNWVYSFNQTNFSEDEDEDEDRMCGNRKDYYLTAKYVGEDDEDW